MLPGANDIKTCFLYINRLKLGLQEMGCNIVKKIYNFLNIVFSYAHLVCLQFS